MKHDPRKQVSDLYHRALEQPPEDRSGFLREACNGDAVLREEVESLLRFEAGATDFLERPAAARTPAMLAPTPAAAALLNGHLGPYQLLAPLGAGGMGEVYRARDTKLGREVAIKILPAHLTADPERRARFTREARLLATLNHPHIGAIYGLEEADGVTALVLELVEGPTLAERLQRGPLPVPQALAIAQQIAEALDAAHEKGIVHRDLKPANIVLQGADGCGEVQATVLDFGLAKLIPDRVDPDLREHEWDPLTGTEQGRILGTPAYMSPEQARGQAVDKRTDIWAFGCILFEMLTGRRPFEGETSTDTFARILEHEPEWTALPPSLSPGQCAHLQHCLKKDLKQRIRDIGDVRLALRGAFEPTIPGHTAPAGIPVRPARSVGLIAVAAAATIIGGFSLPSRPALPSSGLVRLSAELGTTASLFSDGPAVPSLALSRDGQLVAFAARQTANERPLLYVRRLSEAHAAALPDTEGARHPFFSPDGGWIAFFADGKLKKIRTAGSSVSVIADARDDRGGSWGPDDTIVFTPDARPGFGLWRVSANGGAVMPVTTLHEDEVTHRWPHVLPDGQGVLFTAHTDVLAFGEADLVVQRLPHGSRRIVHRGGSYARYVPSGHIVFARDETLFALPFDVNRLEVVGEPVRVVENIVVNPLTGASELATSDDGTIAYVPANRHEVPIYWLARDGKPTLLRAVPADWNSARFSPDGTRLVMQIVQGQRPAIWVYDWRRDVLSRVTSSPIANPMGDGGPVWTIDGQRIVFSAAGVDGGPMNLYWQAADGGGEAEPLTQSRNRQVAGSWHPSGKFLAFTETTERAESDLMILPMEGDDSSGWRPGTPTVFLQTPYWERLPLFSPDGRWIAYLSDESGRWEAYVRPFPGPGGKWQISTGGADVLAWSPVRPELFYGTSEGAIKVVRYRGQDSSFNMETPELWSVTPISPRPGLAALAVHPDGERLAVAPGAVANPAPLGSMRYARQSTIMLIFNSLDELRRTAPRKR